MNETMSLLMATTILAFGGLGLYMYKSDDEDDNKKIGEEEYDENNLLSSNLWSSNEENNNEEDENLNEEIDYPKKRTTRTRVRSEKKYKKTGGTKRRY